MVNLPTTNSAKVYITDDVNTENIEKVHFAYEHASMFIDKKFGTPINNNVVVGKSETAHSIIDEATTLFKHFGMNQTQIENAIIKIKFWCIDRFSSIIEKIDNGERNVLVFIDSNVSKHEWVMISLLYKHGVSFTIITESIPNKSVIDIDKLFNNEEEIDINGTDEALNYKRVNLDEKPITELRQIGEIENAIYSNEEIISVVINGIDGFEDTCNFYGKLNINCRLSDNFRLFEQTLGPVLYKESSKIPRISLKDANYLLCTVPMFFNCSGEEKEILTKALQHYYENIVGTINLQQLYNRLVTTVCKINEILNDKAITHIIFYGAPSPSDAIVLDIINSLKKYNIIVLNSDKNIQLATKSLAVLNLQNTAEYFPMPKVDRRNIIKTAAATAERVVDDQLFNGRTLGLYKPGQFTKFECTRFTTTFDEIKLWWKRDVYMRPGFIGNGNTAIIPTMFKIVSGVSNGMDVGRDPAENQYVRYISRLITNKTFLFRTTDSFNRTVGQMISDPKGHKIQSATDINRTSIDAQKPFYEHGVLNRRRITSGVNYKYGFLSADKQTAVLDAIEHIINDDYIDYKAFNMSREQYIDAVLATLLNLHIDITRVIQWFMYYNESPKVIIVMESENSMRIHGIILLIFLSLMGFDTLIFVPTCYNTIENKVTDSFIYDKHIIGESVLGIETNNIIQLPDLVNNSVGNDSYSSVRQKPKKKGLFSRLFGGSDPVSDYDYEDEDIF